MDVILGILLPLQPSTPSPSPPLAPSRLYPCWKQLQICLCAHVGGFLLGLALRICPSAQKPPRLSYQTRKLSFPRSFLPLFFPPALSR